MLKIFPTGITTCRSSVQAIALSSQNALLLYQTNLDQTYISRDCMLALSGNTDCNVRSTRLARHCQECCAHSKCALAQLNQLSIELNTQLEARKRLLVWRVRTHTFRTSPSHPSHQLCRFCSCLMLEMTKRRKPSEIETAEGTEERAGRLNNVRK